MTPDERQLITGLFDRLRQTGLPEKDRDAEQLIVNQLRQQPDAAYMLVQTALVQEMALEQVQQRVQDLEDQVRQLQQQGRPQSSGGFLGGLFGGGAARPAPQASVPATGRQSSGFGQGGMPARQGSPWGGQQQPMAGQQPAAGGGFMRTAMATAAGVAGGMLVANAISGMMGGGSAQAATGSGAGASGQNNGDTGYGSQSEDMDAGAADPGNWDGGGGGWGDGGGGDE